MNRGKITEPVFKRSVLGLLKDYEETMLQGPGIGINVGIRRGLGEAEFITSAVIQTDHIAFCKLALLRASNNLTAKGGNPYGVSLILTIPVYTEEALLKNIIREVKKNCEKQHLAIMDCQITVSSSVSKPHYVFTVCGDAPLENACKSTKLVTSGMDIVMINYAGMEGTVMLAEEKSQELKTRLSDSFLSPIKDFYDKMQIKDSIVAARKFGAAAMHHVSEGGIFGALWEFGEYLSFGLEADLKKIPISQETIEICEFYDLNPYLLMSSGALLVLTDQTGPFVSGLNAVGIPAAVIGTVIDSKDKIVRNGEEIRYLEPFRGDELYRILE